ncbi:hypothetical protein VCRA2120O333_70182 [Vibrio crassostreae]|nr:hypothetical protein VCRA2120O333_70182 [Vibrio crassostreae]
MLRHTSLSWQFKLLIDHFVMLHDLLSLKYKSLLIHRLLI